ncbi:MAG: hypothetical protein IJR00_13180 [Lachnospiraceae bacterium]|nr:hypothetical protein [Lachnospiraceae bacterium]
MSINRIDFQGAFLRTGDMGAVKAAEDAKPQADQSAFQLQFQKQKQAELTSVKETAETAEQNTKFDAREKSKNEYFKRKKQGEKKDEEEDEGGVIDMNGRPVGRVLKSSGFDFKV